MDSRKVWVCTELYDTVSCFCPYHLCHFIDSSLFWGASCTSETEAMLVKEDLLSVLHRTDFQNCIFKRRKCLPRNRGWLQSFRIYKVLSLLKMKISVALNVKSSPVVQTSLGKSSPCSHDKQFSDHCRCHRAKCTVGCIHSSLWYCASDQLPFWN